MRVCRYERDGKAHLAFYEDSSVIDLVAAADLYREEKGQALNLPTGDDVLSLLPPEIGRAHV